MTKKTTIAIIALAALLGISNIIPGPDDIETEQITESWKRELIEMAKKDHEMLKAAGAFTK